MADRRDDAQRAEFRAFVRTHHPDRGGDTAEFVAGLDRLRTGASPGPAVSSTGVDENAGRDAPIEVVAPLPLPVRVAVALLRTVRRRRHRRVL